MNALLALLRDPEAVRTWPDRTWDDALRQARAVRLLGAVAARLPPELWPQQPALRRRLASVLAVADANTRSVRWEAREVARALAPLNLPVVVLKGGAYVLRDLVAARGRLVTDLDILVPRDALDKVETKLRFAGWISGHHDAYDQRYYRQWMHELPPLQHAQRGTTLDVHHNILPLTARARPRAELLLAAMQPLPEVPLQTLAPADMVLHSISHLFFDGEWDHALRDLVDIDSLLRHYGQGDGAAAFWAGLVPRAVELDLLRPLAYALRVVGELFATPVPADVLADSRAGLPNAGLQRLMQRLFINAAMPDHASCRRARDGLARALLYVRGHYLRMPLHLLLPHLLRKAVQREPD